MQVAPLGFPLLWDIVTPNGGEDCPPSAKVRCVNLLDTLQVIPFDGRLVGGQGRFDGSITVWSKRVVQPGLLYGTKADLLEEFKCPSGTTAAFPDGRFASGGDGKVELFDLSVTPRRVLPVITLPEPNQSVRSLAVLPTRFHHDPDLAIGLKNSLILCDSAGANVLHTFQVNSHVLCLASLPGGLLASGVGTKINLWDVFNKRFVSDLVHHTENVSSLAILANGCLASGCFDGTVGIWAVGDRGGNLVSVIVRIFRS